MLHSDIEDSDDLINKAFTNIVRTKVTVVVLGDLGHSPRMSYHALSLAKEGFDVNFIGYSGSQPHKEVIHNRHISLSYLRPCPQWITELPGALSLFFKTFWQSVVLFHTLIFSCTPKKLLVQNPPSVPALPICWIYCLLKGCDFYIDWHNYGYSIMSLSLGSMHPLVQIYKFIETFFGKLAKGGFCVTKQMRDDLESKWNVKNIIVHYDRPHSQFRPVNDEEKHCFYLKLSEEYQCFSSSSPDKTVFTERFASGRISFYEDRPALIVSSTSWTDDEDFSILLFALQDYERVREEFPAHYPQLIVAITGKGPLKAHYVKKIESRNWQHIVVITPWLTAEDYPKLLASSDLGISLHFSSSGLDLPMKVVDMFGCRLPVMAVSYRALSELVKHNENGLVFSTKEDLANLLQDWFRGFPIETEIKETYYNFYKNIDTFREVSWHSSWICNVLPIFSSCRKSE